MTSERTKLQNIAKSNTVYRALFQEEGLPPHGILWAAQAQPTIDFLLGSDRWTIETRYNYLNAIIRTAEACEHFPMDQLDVYREAYKRRWAMEDTRVSNQLRKCDMDEEGNSLLLPWLDIVATFDRIVHIRHTAVFGIYTLILPRRLEDYRLMRVAFNPLETAIQNLDKRFNWMILDENNLPTQMIIHVYKTSRSYGTYKCTDLPPKLKNTIKSYVKYQKISDGNFLFHKVQGAKTNRNNPLTTNAMTQLVTYVFSKYLGRHTNLRHLRVSCASWICALNPTYRTREAFADAMGHSVQQQLLYNNIDIQNPFDVLDDE